MQVELNEILSNERIILGIDPGTTIMGFGVIKIVNKKMEFVQLNELQLSKYDNHYQKLSKVGNMNKVTFPNACQLMRWHFHPMGFEGSMDARAAWSPACSTAPAAKP